MRASSHRAPARAGGGPDPGEGGRLQRHASRLPPCAIFSACSTTRVRSKRLSSERERILKPLFFELYPLSSLFFILPPTSPLPPHLRSCTRCWPPPAPLSRRARPCSPAAPSPRRAPSSPRLLAQPRSRPTLPSPGPRSLPRPSAPRPRPPPLVAPSLPRLRRARSRGECLRQSGDGARKPLLRWRGGEGMRGRDGRGAN